jgi:hypothetical protein
VVGGWGRGGVECSRRPCLLSLLFLGAELQSINCAPLRVPPQVSQPYLIDRSATFHSQPKCDNPSPYSCLMEPLSYQGPGHEELPIAKPGPIWRQRPKVQAATLWSLIREALKDIKRDFGRIKWGRDLLLFFWISGLLAGYFVFTILSSIWDPSGACTPDGDFTLHPDRYSYWSSSSFFQITFGSGPLTFAEAKAIDIIWDVVRLSCFSF